MEYPYIEKLLEVYEKEKDVDGDARLVVDWRTARELRNLLAEKKERYFLKIL